MVIIDAYGNLSASNKKIESKSFEEIKQDLDDLNEYRIIFEELEKNFFDAENSMHIENSAFIQTQLLISEINEKQEIAGRLNSLSYSVGWLKAATLIKDSSIVNKAIKNIISNEYSSIKVIVSELNSFKAKIDKLEDFHTGLLKGGLSLDVKAVLEQDFRKKRKKLDEVYNKQKNILLNLSSIFINLTRDSVLKNKN